MIQIIQASAHQQAERDTIYFICTGNTCRSPMAEALFRKAVLETQTNFPYKISSGGIMAFSGQKASPEAVSVLKKVDIDISGHRSKLFTDNLARRALAIFGMTTQHLDWIYKNLKSIPFNKTYLMGDQKLLPKAIEIPDPIGGDTAAYQSVLDCMQQIVPELVRFILTQVIK